MAGLKAMLKSPDNSLSDAQAYDLIYGTEQPARHKAAVLENIGRQRRGLARESTLALDVIAAATATQ
jgi:hypothetical protein